MTASEELIEFITNMSTEQVKKVIPVLLEAIDMMNQGKSNEEIFRHFGIS